MDGRFHIGEWTIEPQLNSLADCDRTLRLEPKAMQVLVCLAEHAGEVVPKEKLIRVVWTDTFVGDDVLTRTISDLRKAFGEDAKEPRFIQTIPKRGYRLLVPVVYESVRQETNSQAAAALPEVAPGTKQGRRWLNKPVLVACLFVIGAAAIAFYAWVASKPKRTEARTVKSIAVLPFKPMDAANRDEAFELGMADTLITQLGHLRSLTVRPISAVRKYMGLDQDSIAAGREQMVDLVLDGAFKDQATRCA